MNINRDFWKLFAFINNLNNIRINKKNDIKPLLNIRDKKSLCDILNVGDFMKYKDFYEQEELRERKPEQKNNLIAEEFILKFLEMT